MVVGRGDFSGTRLALGHSARQGSLRLKVRSSLVLIWLWWISMWQGFLRLKSKSVLTHSWSGCRSTWPGGLCRRVLVFGDGNSIVQAWWRQLVLATGKYLAFTKLGMVRWGYWEKPKSRHMNQAEKSLEKNSIIWGFTSYGTTSTKITTHVFRISNTVATCVAWNITLTLFFDYNTLVNMYKSRQAASADIVVIGKWGDDSLYQTRTCEAGKTRRGLYNYKDRQWLRNWIWVTGGSLFIVDVQEARTSWSMGQFKWSIYFFKSACCSRTPVQYSLSVQQ